MAKVKSILLVCTGNSCRSVMAEGLLKKYLNESGREDIEVSSAGTGAIDGLPPTSEAIEAMRQEGVDISSFKSRSLTEEMIMNADLVLVMAAHHMDDVIRRVPEAAKKTHILKQYGLDTDMEACEDLDIPDPIGRPAAFYRHVLGLIKKELERIVPLL